MYGINFKYMQQMLVPKSLPCNLLTPHTPIHNNADTENIN